MDKFPASEERLRRMPRARLEGRGMPMHLPNRDDTDRGIGPRRRGGRPKAVAMQYPRPYDPPPMNSVNRYILWQCLSMMVFVTAALSAAVWLAQSLRLI